MGWALEGFFFLLSGKRGQSPNKAIKGAPRALAAIRAQHERLWLHAANPRKRRARARARERQREASAAICWHATLCGKPLEKQLQLLLCGARGERGVVNGGSVGEREVRRGSGRRSTTKATHRLPGNLRRVHKNDAIRVVLYSRPAVFVRLVAADVPQLHRRAVALQLEDARANCGQRRLRGDRAVGDTREEGSQPRLSRF